MFRKGHRRYFYTVSMDDGTLVPTDCRVDVRGDVNGVRHEECRWEPTRVGYGLGTPLIMTG